MFQGLDHMMRLPFADLDVSGPICAINPSSHVSADDRHAVLTDFLVSLL